MKQHVLSGDRLPFSLPISVGKLASWLQSRYFKNYTEKEVLELVRSVDLNEDDSVGE
jgi:hypothetical protein